MVGQLYSTGARSNRGNYQIMYLYTEWLINILLTFYYRREHVQENFTFDLNLQRKIGIDGWKICKIGVYPVNCGGGIDVLFIMLLSRDG